MAYNWTTGKWEQDNSLRFDWTKAFSSMPMSMNGTPSSGTIQTGILKPSNQNNIYFNQDFSGYNQWHSDNIVMPFYNTLSTSPVNLQTYDFENEFKKALDSYNNAGGFDYLNGTNIDRQHGLHSKGTLSHQQMYYNDPVLKFEDNIIGAANNYYNFPTNPNSGDYFVTNNGVTTRVGRNGQTSDNFFGIQTASRRPTIHISTNPETTLKWDNFFKNLGYVGAYRYLDHWIPTREKSRASRLFSETTQPVVTPPTPAVDDNKNGAPIVSSIYGTVLDPSKISLFDRNQFESSSPFNLTNPTFFDYKIGKVKPTGDDSKGGSQEAGAGDLTPWYEKEGWKNLFNGFKNNLPNLIEGARYAGQIATNRKVYEDLLKGIRPNLMQSYNTYRQVVGDEASKQAYYRRGAEGVTRASQPFTSDADRQMAYQMEAQRQANELQAQGDLIDNQRIRETSELSAQHADANRQRATEVANQNVAQINAANQARWNLSAQRRAADWTSTNNLLLGYENRLRQKTARREAIQDNIDTLMAQSKLENDDDLLGLQSELDALLKDPKKQIVYGGQSVPNWNDPDIIKKQKEIKNLKQKLIIQTLQQRLKSGGKVTYKQKDDLLYKTARDAVKHFREMTKLTDNSYQKSRKRVPKLVPHPKKLQQGGVAPFGVFTPLSMGGEYSQTTEASSTGTRSSSSKSSADDKGKDLLNLAKDLFSKMEGLPIDVSSVYAPISNLLNRVRYSGEELSSHEIATIYLQSMTQLSALKHNQKIYEAAKTQAINNDALDEFVITNGGKIVSQNVEDGSLKALSFDEIAASEGKYNPLTNNNLLELRAHDPKFAFDSNILRYVSDTVGINKVTDQIKKLAGNIGTDEVQQQGYSKKQADNIVKGLELLQNKNAGALLRNAPDGDYEYTETRKSQQNQMNAALNFILTTLPRNMQNTLQAYADMHKVKPTDIIIQGLASQLDSTYKLEWNAVTGKAAKDANGNSGSDSSKATFNDMAQRGQIGIPREFSIITRDGQTKFYSSDSKYVSQLPEVSSDTSIAQMLSESKIGQILDSRLGITFGDQVINSENLKDIMFSVGGGATFVTLPCKYENGHKVVNFAIKDEFDDAIKEASKTTPIDWTDDNFKKNLANILKQKGLDNLLTSSMDIDPNMLGLFLVVEGYTTDRINFNKNSKYIEKINNPDKELENRLNEALSVKGLDGKVQKYDVDINDWNLGFLFEGGWDDIYHANVFIPLNNDPLSAQIGNDTFKRDDARDLAREKQNYLKLINAKNTNSNQLNYETE